MKKTAVEFLEFRYKNNITLYQGDFEEAKELEKQQTIDFSEKHILENLTCNYNGEPICLKEAEQYYNETFNK